MPPGADGIFAPGGVRRIGPLRAGSASLVLHAAVILAAGWLPWSLPDRAVPEVVTVALLVRAPPVRPDDLNAARVPNVPQPEAPPPLRVPETVPIEIPEPAPPEPRPSEPPVRAPIEREAEAPPDSEPEPADEAPQGLRPDVDWEAERRRAARETIEQQSRYRPLAPAEPHAGPLERPWDDLDVFEAPQGPSGPSVLEPGKGRSRFANKVAELCNALTGGGMGLGFNGLGFSLCAEGGARAELFAIIRPDYLESRPVCTEVEPRASADGTVEKTHDCRLVRSGR